MSSAELFPRAHLHEVGTLRFISLAVNQPSSLTPFIIFFVSVTSSLYGLFKHISIHKLSPQLSAFPLCSSSLYFWVTGRAHGLTSTWWGCYGLCFRYKPTEHARSSYSVLMSVSVSVAFSVVFHSRNSSDNSPLSRSVLPAMYLCMKVSLNNLDRLKLIF